MGVVRNFLQMMHGRTPVTEVPPIDPHTIGFYHDSTAADLIMSLPALDALQQKFPDASIHCFVPQDQMVYLEGRHQNIVVQPVGTKAHTDVGVFLGTGKTTRARKNTKELLVGFAAEEDFMFDVRLQKTKEHKVDQYLELVEAIGAKPPARPAPSLTIADNITTKMDGLLTENKIFSFITIWTGDIVSSQKDANTTELRPPFDTYVGAIDRLALAHKIVLLGDTEYNEKIRTSLQERAQQNTFVLELSVMEAAAVCERATVVVTHSQDAMQVAGAVSNKIVCLFADVSPHSIAPRFKKAIAIWKKEDQQRYEEKATDGYFQEITAHDIITAVDRLFKSLR